jgi:hypothetical protein
MDAVKISAREACAEPGRRMFFEHAGRYFAASPSFPRVRAATRCPICGSADAQLFENSSGNPVCLAQHTITRKRPARKSPTEPIVPGGGTGKTAFADGHFAVAGPHCAMLVTNLQPTVALPSGVRLTFGEPGAIRRVRTGIIAAPPEPPFVVIAFRKLANYPVRITTNPTRVVINGNDACVLDRPYLLRCLELLAGADAKQAIGLLRLRDRLAGGVVYASDAERRRDQEELLRLRAEGLIPAAAFRRLPALESPEARFLADALDELAKSKPGE